MQVSRKKKAQEALMKTHVLNLNEIRDAEKKDKYIRRKKLPKWFFILGIVLIVAGLGVSSLLAYKARENAKKKNNNHVKSRDKLVCVSNLINDKYKSSIHTETVYSFDDGYLDNMSVTSESKFTDNTFLQNFQNDIHTNSYESNSVNDSSSGISYSITFSKLKVSIDYDIDYSKYRDDKKQSYLNSYVKVPNVTSKYNYAKIKKAAEKLGALCN